MKKTRNYLKKIFANPKVQVGLIILIWLLEIVRPSVGGTGGGYG